MKGQIARLVDIQEVRVEENKILEKEIREMRNIHRKKMEEFQSKIETWKKKGKEWKEEFESLKKPDGYNKRQREKLKEAQDTLRKYEEHYPKAINAKKQLANENRRLNDLLERARRSRAAPPAQSAGKQASRPQAPKQGKETGKGKEEEKVDAPPANPAGSFLSLSLSVYLHLKTHHFAPTLIETPVPTDLRVSNAKPSKGTLRIKFKILSPGTNRNNYFAQLRENNRYSQHLYALQCPPNQMYFNVGNLEKDFTYSFQAQYVHMKHPRLLKSKWSSPILVNLSDFSPKGSPLCFSTRGVE